MNTTENTYKRCDAFPNQPEAFDTISESTLNPNDLFPAYHAALMSYASGAHFTGAHADGSMESLQAFLDESAADFANGCDFDLLIEHIASCDEWLQGFAPPYCTFGAHEGDGSCIGFWPYIQDDLDSFDGPIIDDSNRRASVLPDDYQGEWLHINDHGNMTLYVRESNGVNHELWAMV